MKRLFLLLAALATVLTLGGCAHPITLNPNVASLADAGGTKIDKRVGLVITDESKKREITTPGGGGDKVSYFPYRDLESGIYFTLSQAFTGVTRLTGPADPKLAAEKLTLVITPEIRTTSFSDSVITWPPTLFTVELICAVVSDSGAPVTTLRVVGDGRASFDEFKSDFSLSAKRASEDALKKLLKAIADDKALR